MLEKDSTRAPGTTVYGENGNPLVQIGGGQAGLPPLPRGQSYYYKSDDQGNAVLDQQGNKIPEGRMEPYTPAQMEEEEGRYIFSKIYPKVNDINSYYSGKGSWERFNSDLENVNDDKNARQRMVDYATAAKLMSPLTVKEQATLKASGTLGMFKALQSSMNSSDIPEALKQYSKFELPADIMKEAGDNMMGMITSATKEANDSTPAYKKYPFNVEKTHKIRDTETGEVRTVSEEEARKLGAIK